MTLTLRQIARAFDLAVVRHPGLRKRVAEIPWPHLIDLDGPTIYLSDTLNHDEAGPQLMVALSELATYATIPAPPETPSNVIAFPDPSGGWIGLTAT